VTLQALPGRLSDIGGLPIRRLLPRSQRRLVGPWCFLDSYGPLTFSSGKPMDVAPHPHMGLQTVSWLLEGALPETSRQTEPAFTSHRSLPALELEGGTATVIVGELSGTRSPARTFSPLVGAELRGNSGARLVLASGPHPLRALLLGGAPFGEVEAYAGPPLPAPAFVARPVPRA
jgi:hypothetical protein